ncbi:MAG: TerB N-terminal domain-containing protein [Synergistaceae bacterium]|nr:TerB N-terminal domain-containing protein [Synergistaceae bacterium]
MFYLVIGIMLVVVGVSAIITQRSRHWAGLHGEKRGEETKPEETGAVETRPQEPAPKAEEEISDSLTLSRPPEKEQTTTSPTVPAEPAPVAEPDLGPSGPSFGLEEEIVPLKPLLAAAPISSPNALTSATYSSVAPPSLGDSPYAYGNTEEAKPKAESTLLRWSGKMGSIQIGDLTIRGPLTYWSDGPSSTPEPSCIDITLPVEYPGGESELPSEGATSYREMTPLQRGVYLLWLAGGRIQPPSHICYPILWLFGLERRVLSDRLDIAVCIGEAFRLLPLIRWESLRQGLIKFITWMAAKAWLPEEQLMAFSRALSAVPTEILNMLLRPYADARLPLPSAVAFTLMRTSSLAEETEKKPIPHTDDLVAQFASKYKAKCSGGLVLPRPKSSLFMAYVPTNPTLAGDKNITGGVLELPDFFKDLTDFAPLLAVWKEFLKNVAPPSSGPEPSSAAEELEKLGDRPDWDSFIRRLQGLPEAEDSLETVEVTAPLTSNLAAVADLMRIDHSGSSQGGQEGEKNRQKPGASDRKKIADTARVEGFLILPDLGIAGKEYHWDDPIVLAPFPSGLRPSQDYNAAALLLEYVCALTGLSGPEGTDKLKALAARLDDYFSLTSDDHVRLDALSSVFLTASSPASSGGGPDNIGECLQFWLQREQRSTVRDFLTDFLTSRGNAQAENPSNVIAAICGSLAIERPPSADSAPLSPEARLELGAQVIKILTPLFKD